MLIEIPFVRRVVAASCLFSALLLTACPESTFRLSPTSRLPRWFSPPAGYSRPDLTVVLSYYTLPWGGRATFHLLDVANRELAKTAGPVRDLYPNKLAGRSYEVVTIGDVTEII